MPAARSRRATTTATPYRDSGGKTFEDYPRPSVAVDAAVLTVPPGADALHVLLVRREGSHRKGAWALPGTFLHPGETLADAVLRALRTKAGVEGLAPRQPVDAVPRLPFDHQQILDLAVADVRARYAEAPDPDRLIKPPFTLLTLRRLHEAVAGEPLYKDTFRRHMQPLLKETGRHQEGVVGKPALLYRHRPRRA
jgi:8-oxo-dGTP diphosphatase